MEKSTKRADLIALGVEVQELDGHADSIMVSISKGLRAPVEPVIGSTADFMERTRRYRKMPGGGMRHTRWLASCGLNALSDENIARLRDDPRTPVFWLKSSHASQPSRLTWRGCIRTSSSPASSTRISPRLVSSQGWRKGEGDSFSVSWARTRGPGCLSRALP